MTNANPAPAPGNTGVVTQTATNPDARAQLELVYDIAVEGIQKNPYNPRRNFDEHGLRELGNSLKHGQVQPIVVREVETPLHGFKQYQLVVGERRLEAAKLVKLKTLKARVIPLTDREALTWLLTENLHRQDLNPIEQATGYQTMMQQLTMTQQEVAKQVGVKQPAIAKLVGLLALPQTVQDLIAGEALTAGHGTALLKFRDNPDALTRVAQLAITQKWSVRDVEKFSVEEAAKLVVGQTPTERPTVAAAQVAADAQAANTLADDATGTDTHPEEPANMADAPPPPAHHEAPPLETPRGSASAADEMAKHATITEVQNHLWELITSKEPKEIEEVRDRLRAHAVARNLQFQRDIAIDNAARGLTGYDAEDMAALKSKDMARMVDVIMRDPSRGVVLVEVCYALETIYRDPDSDIARWIVGDETALAENVPTV